MQFVALGRSRIVAVDGTISIADRITVEMPAAREDIDGQLARVTLTAN
jgi:hypothetical protein